MEDRPREQFGGEGAVLDAADESFSLVPIELLITT